MVKTSAQLYKHIIHAYVYTHIQRTACHAGQQWGGPHTATQDSNNNKVWHREVHSKKQTAPSIANSPIRSGLNLASTHQMAPPSTHLIEALLLIYRLRTDERQLSALLSNHRNGRAYLTGIYTITRNKVSNTVIAKLLLLA